VVEVWSCEARAYCGTATPIESAQTTATILVFILSLLRFLGIKIQDTGRTPNPNLRHGWLQRAPSLERECGAILERPVVRFQIRLIKLRTSSTRRVKACSGERDYMDALQLKQVFAPTHVLINSMLKFMFLVVSPRDIERGVL
jgi:hypothetical protein